MPVQHGSPSSNCKSVASRSKATACIRQFFALRAVLRLPLEDALTNLSSPQRPLTGIARQFALALALASGTAFMTVPGFTEAAQAQRAKKGDKQEAPKAAYSKEFVAAFQPLDAAIKAPGADIAALKPQVLALVPMSVSVDEQQATGGLLFNAGIVGKDPALQLQGVEMMLASGKLPAEELGRYNLVAYQVAANLKQNDKARNYLQRAIDLNYSAENITTSDLQMNMAELFFAENRNVEGLKYLSDAIAVRKAAGQPIDTRWYRRGVSVAYSNQIVPQVYDFTANWVSDDPAPENWRDAVNLTRNLNDFEPQVLLDLLRLGKQVGTLKDKNDFIYYIEAADARRLPMEVKEVIDQARAAGIIPKGTDTYVDEQMGIASGRIATDRAELPALERDANAASAQMRTVVAAGDAFLSYGEYAKAAGFYEKGLNFPGVDRNLVLTRLGIAQIGMGNAAAARASLAQVDGVRMPVAKLWGAYAAQQESGMATGG